MTRSSKTGLVAILLALVLALPAQAQIVLFQGTSLAKAVEANDVETVKAMLQKGESPNSSDVKGRGLLLVAASKGFTEIAVMLLDRGANPDRADDLGNAVLHVAAQRGDMEIVEKSLSRSNRVDIETPQGVTPLMLAARHGQAAVAARLLKAGADPSRTDFTGRSVLDWAMEGRSNKVVSLLRQAGAKR